jgi:D-alanine-D-alanine ligase
MMENAEITSNEVDLFRRLGGLNKSWRILDLCCGQGRHSLQLAQDGFNHVTGYDYSTFLLDTARKRLAELAAQHGASFPAVEFVQGDARELPFGSQSFDAVLCLGNSFGYFTSDNDDKRVLREVARVLKPGGVFLLDVTDGEYMATNYSPHSWEWIGPDLFVCRQRAVSNSMLCSREMIVSTKTGVVRDQFYQERLYTEDSILSILDECGLAAPRLQRALQVDDDPLQQQQSSATGAGSAGSAGAGGASSSTTCASSQQHADPGMMAKRLIFKAFGGLALDSLKFPFPDICVVLGDTSRPTPDKLNGTWNPEDIEVRDKLVAALQRVPRLSVHYLSNHDTLFDDLRRLHPRFVVNFCDEGLYNKPELELHVPAMLEALGLPYSGSSPQTLTICYDKSLVRSVAMSIGVPTPREFCVLPRVDDAAALDQKLSLHNFQFPLFVKPQFGDGSAGITVDSLCGSIDALKARIEALDAEFPRKPILVQEYLTGAEFSVGLVSAVGAKNSAVPLVPNGDTDAANAIIERYAQYADETWRVLPVIQVDWSRLPPSLPKILGFESKWVPDSPYWTALSYHVPETTPAIEQMIELSKKLAERLETRDYVRIDWRADAHGVIKLLEVNPNPGWCFDGHLAMCAERMGWTYSDMLAAIISGAQHRALARRTSHVADANEKR